MHTLIFFFPPQNLTLWKFGLSCISLDDKRYISAPTKKKVIMSAFSSQRFPFFLSTCHTLTFFTSLSPASQVFLRASKHGARLCAARGRSQAKKWKCPWPKCRPGRSQTKQGPQEETGRLWTRWWMWERASTEETAGRRLSQGQARQQGPDQEEANSWTGKANQLFQALSVLRYSF